MADKELSGDTAGRRDFLRHAAAAVVVTGLASGSGLSADEKLAAATLPTIALGPHRVSRLIAGWNPIGGHSHSTLDMSRCMREYFTVERTVEFLEKCFAAGISAWQFDHTDLSVAAIRKFREGGGSLSLICLHAERPVNAPLAEVVKDTAPIAIVHHGGVTDVLFQADKTSKVRDFVKKVKDLGILAGVSTHSPENLKRMADEGWENDFFMTSLYDLTRPREDMEETMKKIPVGEPFWKSDPVEMTSVIKTVKKPCLAFKLLAAGRSCWTPYTTEKAFAFAFKNLKPVDGVIVGMFPRYSDQISENAALTRKHGAV